MAPSDILSLIFHLACQIEEEPCDPVLLSHVCKWWYTVALQDSLLWNKINITHPPSHPPTFMRIVAKTEAFLSRSGESSLSICLTLGNHTGVPHDANPCMSCIRHRDELVHLFGILMGENRRNLNRLTTLVLDASSLSEFPLNIIDGKEFSLLQLLTSFSLPQIESLELITSRYGPMHYPTLCS